jgi:hypothetical protein
LGAGQIAEVEEMFDDGVMEQLAEIAEEGGRRFGVLAVKLVRGVQIQKGWIGNDEEL